MKLQDNIDLFMLWTRDSELTVNALKSKAMSILPTNNKKLREQMCKSEVLKMEGVVLEEVTSYKYLGVHKDNELTFSTHLNAIIKNVAHKVHLLSKIKSKITVKAAIDVFKTMILPLLDNGDVFYHGGLQAQLNKLQSLQNRAVRIMHKMQRLTNVQEQSEKDNLLMLHKRRKLHLIQLAKWLASNNEYRDTTQVSTRSQDVGRKKLLVPFPRKKQG